MRLPARTACLAASFAAVLVLAGCAATSPEGAPTRLTAESVEASAPPSDAPAPATSRPEPAWAPEVVGQQRRTAEGWLDAWDEAGCTAERAADDERECQVLLMDLAMRAAGVADVLSANAEVEPRLEPVAEAAAAAASAASAWLEAWCGGYADAACAAPGAELVDAERTLADALAAW
ncbi:hypothetical protein [Agromyces bauzanensis]